MIPEDEILEALDLSRAQPGSGFLEALFARFNAKVPFENASKIVRDAEVSDPAAKPRVPDVFWADHVSLGTGGTCFARVAAFDALLVGLGFRTRRVLGRVEHENDHAALMVQTPEGESIADVGFPLPALLPARAGTVETALGSVRVEPTDRGFSVALTDGVPEGPRALEIFAAPVSEAAFREPWQRTFQPQSRFLGRVVMRRDLGNRIVSYAGGQVRVDDLHSRLRVSVAAPPAPALSDLFGVDRDVLSRAFQLTGPEAAAPPEFSLTAYLEVAGKPEAALAQIATRAGYRRLLEGVGQVVSEESIPEGFRLTFTAPGQPEGSSAAAIEEVRPDLAARRIRLERRTGDSAFRSFYGADEKAGKTYLLREASFSEAREDLLRNDSMRGRLAGMLALDLLAWSRML